MPWLPQKRIPARQASGRPESSALSRTAIGPAGGGRRPVAVAATHGIGPSAIEHLLCLTAGAVAGTASIACGGLLVARRLSGSIHRLPGPIVLLAVCGAGILLVLGADAAARFADSTRAAGSPPGRAGRLAAVASRVGLMLGLLAIAVPPFDTLTNPAGLPTVRVATTMAAIAAAAAAVLAPLAPAFRRDAARIRREPRRGPAFPTVHAAGRDAPPPRRTEAPRPPPGDRPEPAPSSSDPQPGRLLQRIERYSLPDQSDWLRGRLLLTVPAGARTAHGHVGFCPPFTATPAVDVTTECDSVEAIVSAAEVLPWGVRVECRLDEPAEESFEIPIDLVAHSAAEPPSSHT